MISLGEPVRVWVIAPRSSAVANRRARVLRIRRLLEESITKRRVDQRTPDSLIFETPVPKSPMRISSAVVIASAQAARKKEQDRKVPTERQRELV